MVLGCHVGMNGSEMFVGSVKEAISYGADTFMVYTGAPQNTKRKPVSELRINEATELMQMHRIFEFVVHAPYIINLANTIRSDIFRLSVDFLGVELQRTEAMGAKNLVLHPGSHVGEGEDAGIAQIIKGLNEVLNEDTKVNIALETMSGKGSELGRNFEQLARIFDGVKNNNRLRICMDTCHLNDAGYPVRDAFGQVLDEYHRYFSNSQLACIHLNDSLNPQGASKDRHTNLGFGTIGFEALRDIASREEFAMVPIILETPYVPKAGSTTKDLPPYKQEMDMLRRGVFDERLVEHIQEAMV